MEWLYYHIREAFSFCDSLKELYQIEDEIKYRIFICEKLMKNEEKCQLTLSISPLLDFDFKIYHYTPKEFIEFLSKLKADITRFKRKMESGVFTNLYKFEIEKREEAIGRLSEALKLMNNFSTAFIKSIKRTELFYSLIDMLIDDSYKESKSIFLYLLLNSLRSAGYRIEINRINETLQFVAWRKRVKVRIDIPLDLKEELCDWLSSFVGTTYVFFPPIGDYIDLNELYMMKVSGEKIILSRGEEKDIERAYAEDYYNGAVEIIREFNERVNNLHNMFCSSTYKPLWRFLSKL